jgi:hypothetical protein
MMRYPCDNFAYALSHPLPRNNYETRRRFNPAPG